MRNLFVFFIRNHFFLLFLILEIIAINLIITYNTPQQAQFNLFSNTIYSHLHTIHNSVTKYFNLKEINKQLAQENAKLREKLPESMYSNTIDPQTIRDKTHTQQYEFIPAEVINNSIHKPHNYIIINKGSRHGIHKNMGVISPQGITGIVISTSQNFSKILTILSSNLKISGQLQNTNFYGSVHWDGKHYRKALLTEIPVHAPVQKGDTVITNSFSNIYPTDINIGVVSSVKKTENDNFYDIEIELSTDFKNLEHVYVVLDLMKTERELLEKRQ
ncbi:MAG: rod shape-determining protein MreC [Bacteroidales bacterium]